MTLQALNSISLAIKRTNPETPAETKSRIDAQWLEAIRIWQEADEADGGYTLAGDPYEIIAQSSQRAA